MQSLVAPDVAKPSRHQAISASGAAIASMVHQAEGDRGVTDLAGDARSTQFHWREPQS